jgi:isopentenyl-diphosphate delta-isomerase
MWLTTNEINGYSIGSAPAHQSAPACREHPCPRGQSVSSTGCKEMAGGVQASTTAIANPRENRYAHRSTPAVVSNEFVASSQLSVLESDDSAVQMNSVSNGELVVLLDEAGRSIGSAPKSRVHHHKTPLHLAFSCYLFDDARRVLVTRRALDKRTFPGVWTNSFCGHPTPNESVDEAVIRLGRQELGVDIAELHCVLPEFRYRAVAPDGVVENEVCPVFVGRTVGMLDADPNEIMDSAWVPWDELFAAAQSGWAISPWAVEQVPLLEAAGAGQHRQFLSWKTRSA